VVALSRAENYETATLERAAREVLDHLGGLERFAGRGDIVLLKPSMLSAREPERAVTTHPEVVRVFIKMLKGLGATVVVGDSPAGAHRGVARVWERTGILQVCRAEKVELLNFEASGGEMVEAASGRILITDALKRVDLVVNLAKLKTHSLTLLTGSVKNLFGVVPGFVKGEAHKRHPKAEDFSGVLLDVYSAVKPALSFVDAVVGMEGEGPASGEPRLLGFVAAGVDAVALDTVASEILGVDPLSIPTTRLAAARNLGVAALEDIELKGEPWQRFAVADFKLPSSWSARIVPGWLAKLIGKWLWIRPVENPRNCTRCGLCIESCPVSAVAWSKDGAGNLEFDYRKCVSCLCCHEICGSRAIELERSWLARKL